MARILVAVTDGDYHAQTRFDSIMDGGVESLGVVAPQGQIRNLFHRCQRHTQSPSSRTFAIGGVYSFPVFWRIRLLPSCSSGAKSHLYIYLPEDAL